MKNLFFTSILLFSVFNVLSQEYKKSYFGNEYHLLVNSTAIVDTSASDFSKKYIKFYKSYADAKNTTTPKLNYIHKKGEKHSDFELVKGLKFKVVGFYNFNGELNIHKKSNYIQGYLILKDDKGLESIVKYENYDFPFLFKDIQAIPVDYYCSEISVKIDEFNKTKTYSTPFGGRRIELSKTFNSDGSVRTLLTLVSFGGNNPQVNEKGLTILLENDKKLDFPNQSISIGTTNSGYSYTVFLELDSEQIENLINNNIVKWKIVFENEEYNEFKNRLPEHLKCLNKITD